MAVVSDVNPFTSPPKGDNDFARVTDNVSRIAEVPKPPRAWYIAFAISTSMLAMTPVICGAISTWCLALTLPTQR